MAVPVKIAADRIKAVEVQVRCVNDRKHREEVADALVEFKKRVKKSGLLQDLRKHDFYQSPSRARQLKREESQRQRRRDERKQEWYSRTHTDF